MKISDNVKLVFVALGFLVMIAFPIIMLVLYPDAFILPVYAI